MKIRRQDPMTENTLLLTPLEQMDPHENRVAAHLITINGVVALTVIITTNATVDLGSLAEMIEQAKPPSNHTAEEESVRLLRALHILRQAGHVLEYTPF